MKSFETEQEKFWAGEFGNDYTKRNIGKQLLAANTNLFSRIIERTSGVRSVIEFGANIGANLDAVKRLLPDVELSAIEINESAVEVLKKRGDIKKIYAQSMLDYEPDYQRDLVLIKTVLIHINPDKLQQVYDLLYRSSRKYIVLAEYYNPVPTVVTYRGNENKLFKRDFAGEMLDKFPGLRLVDYGFAYRRDPNYGKEYDDINWFLFEKE